MKYSRTLKLLKQAYQCIGTDEKIPAITRIIKSMSLLVCINWRCNMKKIISEIGRTSIDEKVRMKLWAISGGRCEMCNRLLYEDSTFGVQGNFAENAHIHAVSTNGPRHKYNMSESEKNNISNLMLLCEEHHHMIDTNPEEFKDGLLMQYKVKHENRIRTVTDIKDNQSCRLVAYFSNIDRQEDFCNEQLFKDALITANKLPMQQPVINLHAATNTRYEATKRNFIYKASELENNFRQWFDAIIKSEDSIAVFSLAPQPLLIKLGTLINDQYNAIVFQCHRNGHKWAWKDSTECPRFIIKEPLNINCSKVALIVDLSAEIKDDRIKSKLGDDTDIYHITLEQPNRNFVTNPNVQQEFIQVFRNVMEKIKNLRPQPKLIYLFTAMPNSLAIKLGMDYMPKTDIPMLIFEQANATDGFFETIMIGE